MLTPALSLNTLQQITWRDDILQHFDGVVDTDMWWMDMDDKIIEGYLFSKLLPKSIEAHSIAPWIPPACRGPRVTNII